MSEQISVQDFGLGDVINKLVATTLNQAENRFTQINRANNERLLEEMRKNKSQNTNLTLSDEELILIGRASLYLLQGGKNPQLAHDLQIALPDAMVNVNTHYAYTTVNKIAEINKKNINEASRAQPRKPMPDIDKSTQKKAPFKEPPLDAEKPATNGGIEQANAQITQLPQESNQNNEVKSAKKPLHTPESEEEQGDDEQFPPEGHGEHNDTSSEVEGEPDDATDDEVQYAEPYNPESK